MLRSEYHPDQRTHRYRVWIDSTSENLFFAYPAVDYDNKCFIRTGNILSYPDEPSEQLKSLIASYAPMEVIIDKLIEEYPQWEEKIMQAYGQHLREQASA